ncbi:MAG TPA: hypothetical protein VL651_15365 [Bacteroidia bacterium]|jgi:UDP-N-acetylmuramoylalanine--D-glutamate ligase|nr:hypothetical protein [Bacteroidia bacterium]
MEKRIQEAAPFREIIDARLRMQGENAHHLETVCDRDGVLWINNSIATTVDLTWYALRDLPASVILVIGGIDRANDHHKLKELIAEKVETIICLGSTPWIYADTFRNDAKLIVNAEDTDDAVRMACKLRTAKTKVVLFSPSCPSYDAFDNYRNRGDRFKNSIKENLK